MPFSFLDPDELCLARAGDGRAAGPGDHVDLAAHPKLTGKIQSGLYREAGVGQQEALVVGFQVVQMRAIAMQFDGDVVARAMREEGTEATGVNDLPGGIVRLPARDGLSRGVGGFDACDGRIPRIAHKVEDLPFAPSGLAADDARPGDVVPD